MYCFLSLYLKIDWVQYRCHDMNQKWSFANLVSAPNPNSRANWSIPWFEKKPLSQIVHVVPDPLYPALQVQLIVSLLLPAGHDPTVSAFESQALHGAQYVPLPYTPALQVQLISSFVLPAGQLPYFVALGWHDLHDVHCWCSGSGKPSFVNHSTCHMQFEFEHCLWITCQAPFGTNYCSCSGWGCCNSGLNRANCCWSFRVDTPWRRRWQR